MVRLRKQRVTNVSAAANAVAAAPPNPTVTLTDEPAESERFAIAEYAASK